MSEEKTFKICRQIQIFQNENDHFPIVYFKKRSITVQGLLSANLNKLMLYKLIGEKSYILNFFICYI